MRTLELWRELK